MTTTQFKEARKAKNMDQRELASFLKVSYSAVTKWETGKNPIPEWVADRLLDKTGKFILNGFTPEEVMNIQRRAASKGVSSDALIADMVRAQSQTLRSNGKSRD